MEARSILKLDERTTGAPGMQVILGKSDTHFPRHSEGDLVQLADQSLLAAWSRFDGVKDDDRCEIVGRRSRDGGRSWSELEIIASLSDPAHHANFNLMSVSFLPLDGGSRILMSYLGKEQRGDYDHQVCFPFCRCSDDGQTFSMPIPISDREHCYVINNARFVQLSNGRILAPAAVTLDCTKKLTENQAVLAFLSDDHGQTWRRGQPRWLDHERYRNAVPNPGWLTLQEPGVMELKDGSVFMVIRTALNHPFASISKDGGETWSDPQPIRELHSPRSPQTLARLPRSGRIGMLYNENPKGGRATGAERRPLSLAVSADEGATFQFVKNVEIAEGFAWSYIVCRFVGDEAFLLYKERPQDNPWSDFKLSIVPLSWLDER